MLNAFNSIDFTTPEGAKLRERLSQRLEELRGQLEASDMDERATNQTRGAIREIKNLLAPSVERMTIPSYYDAHRRV